MNEHLNTLIAALREELTQYGEVLALMQEQPLSSGEQLLQTLGDEMGFQDRAALLSFGADLLQRLRDRLDDLSAGYDGSSVRECRARSFPVPLPTGLRANGYSHRFLLARGHARVERADGRRGGGLAGGSRRDR